MDRSYTGGILELTALIEDHRVSLAADFRREFGVSIYEIGTAVSYAEAVDLVQALQRDPGTYLFQELAQWSYPYSRTNILLADLFDLIATVNWGGDGEAPTHPRPYKPQNSRANRLGDIGDRTEAEIKAKLRAMSGRDL